MSFSSALQHAIPRIPKQRRLLIGLSVQALLPAISLYVALLLRLELDASLVFDFEYWLWMPILTVLRVISLVYFKAHTGLWRYVSVPDLIAMSKATTVSTVIFAVIVAAFTDFEGMPRSVFVVEWGVHIFLAGGLRMAVRVGRERLARSGETSHVKRNVIIVGAGDAGAAFCAEVKSTPEFRIHPVAAVDDNLSKIGLSIIGVPVVGTTDDLPAVVKKYNADMVVIAVPAATTEQRQRIIDKCRESRIEFRILPGTEELLEGNVSISKLRRVDVTDLLGRPETHLDESALKQTFTDRTVMITGGAGTIGSELARRVIAYKPATILLVDRAENPLVLLEYELRALLKTLDAENVDLVTRIADVTDPTSIRHLTSSYKVDVVLHTAAHKHVYLMEDAPADAITNNVGGVLNVARAALESGVSTFVLVSTDKAVAPTSVMGASKRMAELAIQELGADESTTFAAVRFGNVLGSNASVVPIFQQQIEAGGPVTITHPDAERYFMTAYEAAGLILMAATIGKSREIYLLDMGEPVNIDSLARTMIELSGMVPEQDIAISYTGLKAGEKLTEVLSSESEELEQTSHPKIMRVMNLHSGGIDLDKLEKFVEEVKAMDTEHVRNRIKEFVTDFNFR